MGWREVSGVWIGAGLALAACGEESPSPPKPAIGSIEICRVQGLVDDAQRAVDQAHIQLPRGLQLSDFGREDDPIGAGHIRGLVLITTAPLDLPVGTRCAIVAAKVSPHSKVVAVTPEDGLHLEIGAIVDSNGDDNNADDLPKSWDNVSDLVGHVKTRMSR